MAIELLGSLLIDTRLEVEDILHGETEPRLVVVEVWRTNEASGVVRLNGCAGDIVHYDFPSDTVVVDGVIPMIRDTESP